MNIAEIARQIAGGDPPDWLTAGLESSVAYLRMQIEAEESWPPRVKLRTRFKQLAKNAEAVRQSLSDPAIRQLLRVRGWQSGAEFGPALDRLVEFAKCEAANISPRGGRDLHVPAKTALSPRVLCAVVIVVAWRLTRRAEAPHTARMTHNACAALWSAAGGKTAPWVNATGWRQHLEFAKSADHQGNLAAIEDRFLTRPEQN